MMLAAAIVLGTLASDGGGQAAAKKSLVLTGLCNKVLMDDSNITLVMSNFRFGATTPAAAASEMTSTEAELAADASEANEDGFADVAHAALAMRDADGALARDVAAQNPTAELNDQHARAGAIEAISSACTQDGGQ